jgi:hypothetical protein
MAQQIMGRAWLLGLVLSLVGALSISVLSPAVAQAQAISLHPATAIIEDIPPGGSARIVLEVGNTIDRDYSFHLSAAQPSHLREGYSQIPDLSWISFDKQDIELPVNSSQKVTVTVSIPDDEELVGKKYQAEVKVVSEEPTMVIDSDLLITVGRAAPVPAAATIWWAFSGIAVALVAGIVICHRRSEKQRTEWATGLKSKHWLG